MITVAINGYGRIGRNVHRQFLERFSDKVTVVAVNASSKADMRAYLLKYDSLHGKCTEDIEVLNDSEFRVNDTVVRCVRERDPANCPWKELNIDIVIEATGNFVTYEAASAHLKAGAKKVLVTAPMKDSTPTFVKGVNDHELSKDLEIVSNASCTTNCIAPVISVLDKEFGIEHLFVNSVHAFTVSQKLLDNNNGDGDKRRARAATLSIIPTKTGAVKACGDIFPHLAGRIDGMAMRVPVPTVSCAYMSFTFKNPTTKEEVIEVLEQATKTPQLNEVLSVTHEQVVSIDIQTDPHSSIVDAQFTKVINDRALQLLSWYDNEWGYAMRVSEMTLQIM